MLSARQAARLARDSELAPGSRHAQAALRSLAGAGDSGEQVAIDAVWRSWCRVPDEARWELLSRWRDLAELTEAACTAATLQLLATGEAGSRLPRAAFCVTHGLAPADPVDRVLFYWLTGQQAQHRAADPDGALTTRAYAGADDRTRRVLRQALAGAGSLDLARVIAASGTRARPLAPAEWEYLGSEFSSRQDWDGLWHLVREMPLGAAVEWTAKFGAGWHPASERDRALFRVLRAADPGQVRAGRDALTDRFSRFAVHGGLVSSGALAGDGWRFAVVTERTSELPGPGGEQTAVTEFDLINSAASTAFRVRSAARHVTVGYLGTTLAVAIGHGQGGYPDGALVRLPDGRMVPLSGVARGRRKEGFFTGPLSSPPGGFGILARDRLALHDGDGAVAGVLALAAGGHWTPDKFVAGPGGLLALLGVDEVVLYDTREPARPRLVGRAGITAPDSLCFPGPRSVVAKGAVQVCAWQIGDHGLDLAAAEQIAARQYSPALYRSYLVPVHRSDAVALLRQNGDIEFRDARTLAKVPLPEWLPVGRAQQLWSSPDGAHWALAGRESVAVPRDRHPVAGVADRPVSEWIPADLDTLAAAVSDPGLHPAARPLAELLRDCLECRFATEVRLGSSALGGLGGEDIALSSSTASSTASSTGPSGGGRPSTTPIT